MHGETAFVNISFLSFHLFVCVARAQKDVYRHKTTYRHKKNCNTARKQTQPNQVETSDRATWEIASNLSDVYCNVATTEQTSCTTLFRTKKNASEFKRANKLKNDSQK